MTMQPVENQELDVGLTSTAEAPGEEQAQEEPDYQALYEQEKTAREKQTRDSRAQQIQLRQRKQTEDMITGTREMVRDIWQKLNTGELTAAQAEDAINAGVTEAGVKAAATATLGEVRPELEAFFTEASTTEAIDPNGPEMRVTVGLYEDARQAFLNGNAGMARQFLNHAQNAFSLVKEQAKSPARTRAANAALAVNERSTPAAAPQTRVQRPEFDPRGGHVRQLLDWEKQQGAQT